MAAGGQGLVIMKRTAWIFILFLIAARPLSAAAASDFSASAAVESRRVFVGESFVYQITVEGEDSPDQPKLPDMPDFSARFVGGQQNNSSSITIINGRMTQDVHRGYVFSWQLTPKRAGTLEIPSVTVTAGNKSVQTQPVAILASKPQEMDDFKLELQLSTDTCYVGQPVTVSAIWYISADLQQFQFNLPVLDDPRFTVADWNMPVDPKSKDRYLQVPLGDKQAVGIKERRNLNGKPYMTVRIDKVLIPKTAGKITLAEATVSFTAVTGYRRPSGRSMMDNFFGDDFFGNFRQPVTKKFVIPSNTPELTVKPLPSTGRPDNFNGLVGDYSISAKADPIRVKVGDPITLTLTVTGPDYLDPVQLPPLNQQPDLTADFRIPAEMAPGVVKNGAKVFTQTIRAARADVKAIPSISLPYFDAKTGEYRIASTKPIPLQVSATRVVTARDAEGIAASAAPEKNELETRAEGIAYNYDDLSVLQDQAAGPDHWIHSPLWIGLLAGFPALYFILFGFVAFRRFRLADPDSRGRKKAYARLLKQLKAAENPGTKPAAAAEVLSVLREYLAAKLHLSPGARTWREIEVSLQQHGIDESMVAETKLLFDICEAMGYGGISDAGAGPARLAERAAGLAKKLERGLS